ncbi:unnamed protein product [Lepeophtheirus salmonis]|uniref:(salmon louse) hypothetical protein n=1 Tax=Lepeophtheirus salmonis TaxID=72036 RepID=A0A7R8H7C1_LEPSM|nr:unnamed protein product [Lepeophtheirus salmonis]CAF2905204.1 unnamed protein product [Lepeophtheirus salmonis]
MQTIKLIVDGGLDSKSSSCDVNFLLAARQREILVITLDFRLELSLLSQLSLAFEKWLQVLGNIDEFGPSSHLGRRFKLSVANLEMPKIIDISHPPPLMVLPNWKANTGTSETESVKSSQSPVDNSNCVLPFRPIPEKSIKSIKNWTREWMWDFLERSSSILSNFPRPCYGEIPNYQNSKSAAILFSRSKTFESAKVVLLSPSASLTYMRELCLRNVDYVSRINNTWLKDIWKANQIF